MKLKVVATVEKTVGKQDWEGEEGFWRQSKLAKLTVTESYILYDFISRFVKKVPKKSLFANHFFVKV